MSEIMIYIVYAYIAAAFLFAPIVYKIFLSTRLKVGAAVYFKDFYQVSLSIPIICPSLAYLYSWLLPSSEDRFISDILVMFIPLSGVQYLFFAAYAYFVITRSESASRLRRLAWLSPLTFTGFDISGTYLWFLYNSGYPVNLSAKKLVFKIFFSLLFGCIYCGMIQLAYTLLKKEGLISQLPSETLNR